MPAVFRLPFLDLWRKPSFDINGLPVAAFSIFPGFFSHVLFSILLYFTCPVHSCRSTSGDSCGLFRQNLLN